MRIEELIIDGFKSYPVRTHITGWDPSFNAITGLNGSGKSNILDAICFVLGNTNMAQMRAQNQQDLIYKRGQAGVTKASVTVVFDNSDTEKSPPGYEEYKQITVTRTIGLPNVSKFFFNGHKTPQATIQTLFQSVQLNISNPNFLIMQGKITKVLNMRPPEILGMIEEASGTRMFEERKDKAKKTMAKKDKKLQESHALVEEEIKPKLKKLREEKKQYAEYIKATNQLEKLGRKLRAYEWVDANRRITKKDADIEAKQAQISKTKADKKKAMKDCEGAEKEVQAVAKRRDAEMAKGGKLKQLQDQVSDLGKKLAKLKTQHELKRGTIVDETTKYDDSKAEIAALEDALVQKQAQVDNLSASFKAIKDAHSALEDKLRSDEELVQTLLTGLASSNNKNKGGGYMGQIADARARGAQAEAEETQSRRKLANAEAELKSLENKMKVFAKEAEDSKRKLEAARAAVEGLTSRVELSGWDAEQDERLELGLKRAKADVTEGTDARDRLKQRIRRLDFEYEKPSPHFDTRKVKGVAAQLIGLEKEHYAKSTALEIAAGGKLFNVVVEDEQVGKDLIHSGRMKKRFTFIPLSKISGRSLTSRQLSTAEHYAPGKVHAALSLIGFDEDVRKAMEYIFGDTVICDDAQTAQLVTYNKEIGARSVTLQGDVYETSGTLSGGAKPSSSNVLVQVQELLSLESMLRDAKGKLRELEKEEEATRSKRATWKTLSRELDIKKHELKLLEEQVGGSGAALNAGEVERVKTEISTLKSAIKAAQDKQKAAKDECKKLEKDMEEFKTNKDGKIEELKASIVKQKAALQKHVAAVKAAQKDHQTAVLEIDQTTQDLDAQKEKQKEAKSGIAKLDKELEKLAKEIQSLEARCEVEHAKAEETLEEEMATLSRFDTELKELDKVIKEKKHLISQADRDVGDYEQDLVQLDKDRKAAVTYVANLEKMHPWVVEDKDQFGQPGTQYDFENMDVSTTRAECEKLEATQKSMKKKVNPKVMSMIDSVEKRELELLKHIETVQEDRQKIVDTIEELDRYKRDALNKTWQKVNEDFGAIFAELLPGNFAKLQPPDDKDLMDGLEVKVRLGTVWKQSLTELSGGQRSLIALSLIMALLQFKPAPMYILDEIDAALDLSHTQHIGQLFRTRFKGSQFIVVSLKEGLFTNANVLFRARFRDNTSIVERTAQRSGSALYSVADQDEEAGDGDAERRGGGRRRRVAA